MSDHQASSFPPVPPRRRNPVPAALRILTGLSLSFTGVVLVMVVLPLFIWFGCRIEPGAGEIAVLIRKTGTDLPSGQILALAEGQKGIQLPVLAEGRYFMNPYTWGWEIHKIIDVPAGKLGVRTRLYGSDPGQGEIIAREGTKGIVAEVLRPGKYRVNPYAEHVELFDAVPIRPGHVGVVTSLVGKDVLNSELPESQRNGFLVVDGLKGVLAGVLDPGTYYVNPYMLNIVEVNLQSQRFEMSGSDVISFLTLDGFTVTVEGTIEFGLRRDDAALLTHRVGDMDDVVKKVILPRARGFSRIEGSKHPAINFIVGETRQKFQNDLETHLRDKSMDWGVDIKSVLVRKIIVPDEIASISRAREVAVQDAKKYDQQISQAKSKAELGKQEMLAVQNREKVEAETARIRAVIAAKQDQEVRVIAGRQALEVAKVDLEAAQFQVEGIRLRAEGERDAIAALNEAEAAVLGGKVKAFGSGMGLARYRLYQKLGPQIDTILTDDGEGGLGSVFRSYLPAGKGGAQ
jgi:regulator of protease activity HflC (stomatin/prohibitin superfamily)